VAKKNVRMKRMKSFDILAGEDRRGRTKMKMKMNSRTLFHLIDTCFPTINPCNIRGALTVVLLLPFTPHNGR
jgi:hypothetical protein